MKKTSHAALWTLFSLYCLILLYLLFAQRWGSGFRSLNLVPIRTLRQMFLAARLGLRNHNGFFIRLWVVNVLGNVLVFIPVGLFLPGLWAGFRSFWRFLACTVGLIGAVELSQFALRLGSCDIDDLILNVLGAALGFGLWHIGVIRRALERHHLIR